MTYKKGKNHLFPNPKYTNKQDNFICDQGKFQKLQNGLKTKSNLFQTTGWIYDKRLIVYLLDG